MKKLLAILLVISTAVLAACSISPIIERVADVPEYDGNPYVEINGNIPEFTDKEKSSTKSFEKYSRLDRLGRCGVAFANISTDLMPDEERTSISSIKPSGWVQKNYVFVENGRLYNRCHLIAHMLTGENANKRNLITGTRYMNNKGMLPFETDVCQYILETKNHVLYRVTPYFKGNNLVASGVQIEAWSVEDNGREICFNVYCYNVQPGVMITYADGNSKPDGTIKPISGKASGKGSTKSTITSGKSKSDVTATYILNTSRKKFHKPDCSSTTTMSSKNKRTFKGERSELIKQGYEPCGICNP